MCVGSKNSVYTHYAGKTNYYFYLFLSYLNPGSKCLFIATKKYHIDLSDNKEENKKHFYSVKTIADFIRGKIE